MGVERGDVGAGVAALDTVVPRRARVGPREGAPVLLLATALPRRFLRGGIVESRRGFV
jgi:hypothetical protein